MPAVLDRFWRRRAGFVRSEILAREDASERADVIGDRRGELAPIQRLRAAASDGFERACEIGLKQTVRRLEASRRAVRRAALAVVHALCLRVLVKANRGRAEDERAVPVHHHPVARDPYRGLE